MEKSSRNEEAMQSQLRTLEAENERLSRIVRQLNATLQKLIETYVLSEK